MFFCKISLLLKNYKSKIRTTNNLKNLIYTQLQILNLAKPHFSLLIVSLHVLCRRSDPPWRKNSSPPDCFCTSIQYNGISGRDGQRERGRLMTLIFLKRYILEIQTCNPRLAVKILDVTPRQKGLVGNGQ